MKTATSILWALAVSSLSWPVMGQAPNVVFSYKSAANPAPVTVVANGTVDLGPVQVGSTTNATLVIGNGDTVAWVVSAIFVSGPPFQITSASAAQIAPGENQTYGLSFQPLTRGAASGTLSVRMTNGLRTLSSDFTLAGTGQQANLICSYMLSTDGNQVLLSDNATINFPDTQVGQSATGTFIISNTGNGPGSVSAVSLAAAGAFRLSDLPLLPAQLEAGKDFRFAIKFTPTSSQPTGAMLQVIFPDKTRSFNLSGQGTSPLLVYDATVGSSSVALTSGGTLTLPPTNVGSSNSATVRILNAGNSSAQVGAISVTGAGFQLTNSPVLPATLAAGQAATFTVVFSPAQSGTVQGTLRIDGVSFALSGTGLGSVLSLTVTQGSTAVAVADNGLVVFPNTAVGSKSAAVVAISNTGNVATYINGIGLTGDAYTLENLPPLPALLDPGQELDVTISFAPKGSGGASGMLQINSLRINLTGVGLPPPALPAVSFGNLGNSVEPAQQPSVSVSLAAPYPLDISGKLIIGFTSEAFVDDQAIQFSTGGRSVNFTIPANTTQAIFGASATELQFQTGTVAGTITFTASFATGAVSLTPASPPVKSVIIAASAPSLRSVQIGTRTANSFEVIVTGISTSRAVTEFNLQFTPAPGSNLQTTSLRLDVANAFGAWYGGAASAPFGSQFSAVLNIAVAGDINAVQAVAVTARNQNGDSAPVSASLR